MDREALADFLRRRRESLTPDDVGLVKTPRRRTPGLRREEVAALANISVNFYEQLEQARGSRPSQQSSAALAQALRLSPQERIHLFQLAGHTPPPLRHRTDHPSPGMLRILRHLDTPAQIVTDLGVTLRQNPLALALLGDQTGYVGLSRSIIYRWFVHPEQRLIHPPEDCDGISRGHVSTLRSVLGSNSADAEALELIDALKSASVEFRELWDRHEVGTRTGTTKRFLHPMIGEVRLECHILVAENQTERLVVFTVIDGTADAERLDLLRVVGSQRFGARDATQARSSARAT